MIAEIAPYQLETACKTAYAVPTGKLTNQFKAILFCRVRQVMLTGNLLQTVKMNNPFSLCKIFSISFNHLAMSFQTKVLKVSYRQHTIYKIVMTTAMCARSPICWLQRQEERWTVLLGKDIDSGMVRAIAKAIQYQE